MKKSLFFVLCVSFLLAACGGKPTAAMHIKITLGYIPNVQFAPIYVAVDKGYFAAEGVDVELSYMDENQAVALVGADELQFAVISGEQVLLARAQGLPVVYVAAWYQQYPVSVVANSSEGIHTPADLRGKKIGLPGLYGANYIGLRALLHAGGLTESDVTLDSIGYTQIAALVTTRDQAVSVYTANEPVQLRSRHIGITELRVADYVQLASNGLITNEKTIANNPNLVKRVVRAFLHGLSDTISDPVDAYRISMDSVEGLIEDDPVQMQVLTTSIELWKADRLGASDPQAWENMQSVLLDMGLLSSPLDVSQAFTNQFLP